MKFILIALMISLSITGLTASNCGETLSMWDNWGPGTITYKLNETLGANERCVWTLRIPGAHSANFDLVTSGINGTDPYDRITISAFRHYLSDPFTSTKFLRNETDKLTFADTDLLIITFTTGPNAQGTGFQLNYTATNSTGNTSLKSVDVITKAINGSLNHPEIGKYDNNELSSFIFAPLEFNLNSKPTIHTEWRLTEFPAGCTDFVNLYKFYIDIGWSFIDRYCNTPTTKISSHTDMLMMLFKSGANDVGNGFKINWYTD